jgi:hypothetical protein
VPLFAITTMRGPRWNSGVGIREQELWIEHAAFADGLVVRGIIVLGGPIRDPDHEVALIAVVAADEAAVRAIFAEDPWITVRILELRQSENGRYGLMVSAIDSEIRPWLSSRRAEVHSRRKATEQSFGPGISST